MNCDYCNKILDSETFILECGHIVHRGCGYIIIQNSFVIDKLGIILDNLEL
jgi:hypothetical protein